MEHGVRSLLHPLHFKHDNFALSAHEGLRIDGRIDQLLQEGRLTTETVRIKQWLGASLILRMCEAYLLDSPAWFQLLCDGADVCRRICWTLPHGFNFSVMELMKRSYLVIICDLVIMSGSMKGSVQYSLRLLYQALIPIATTVVHSLQT
jgi:hypothetical protein